MNYTEFLSFIQDHLPSVFNESVHIHIHKIIKNNDTELDGLSILEHGQHISPTIYLNDFYEDYLSGDSPHHILKEILKLYQEHKRDIPFDISMFQNYNKIKSHLACKLIHHESNKRFLSDVPHRCFLDLALIAYVVLKEEPEANATITIHQEHLKMWGITKHQLLKDAQENSPLILPASIIELNQMIQGFLFGESIVKNQMDADLFSPFHKDELNMYVLTNYTHIHGASAMLYPQTLSNFAEQMNSDIFILPSSIHEVILVPDYGITTKKYLEQMVREVNQQEVAQSEQLSNHVYQYHRISRDFSM